MKTKLEQIANIEKFKSLRCMHWLVVASSLLLTLGAWYVSQHQVDEKAQARFDYQIRQVVGQITERMQKYEDALWGGVAAINSQSNGIDYKEWKRFADTLHIDTKYPGINGIGVIFHVPPEKLEGYLAEERELRPDYNIHPKHDKNEYWPITYVEPVATNAKAVGLDIAFETNRHEAAKKARDTGLAQITAPIVLVQDAKKTPGFLFYAPFYEGNTIPATLEERQKKFIGMVYAPFITYRLMDGTLKKDQRLVNVRLRDGDEVIYDEFGESSDDLDPDPMFARTVEVSMYGRPWQVDIRTALSFRNLVQNDQPKIVLVGGLLVDVMLLWVFVLLTRSNKHAAELAHSMTKDLQKTNRELVESQEAISKAVEGISYIDTKGCYLKLNAAYAGIAGYTPKELEGKPWSKTVHPDDMPLLEKAYADMLRDGKVLAEARGVKKDGSEFYKRVTMLSQYDDAGKFVGHHCFMQDITERKKNEEQLKLLNKKLQLILDNIGEGIYSLDLDGHTTSANRAALEMLGYSLDEMLKVSQHDLIHHHHADGTDYPKKDCNIYAALKDGKTHTIDKEVFWKKDGTALPIEYSSKPVHDENGAITGVVVVFRDISERKQQEAALRESQERYNLVVRGMSVGLWDWNVQTGELYWSDKFKEITGIEKDFLPQYEEFSRRLHPDDKEKTEQALFSHVENKMPYNVEYRLRHNDGSYVWIHATGQAEWDENGKALRVAGSVDDITDRKEMERIKGEFVSIISHELRTPLTSIRGSLGLMVGAMAKELPEKANKLLNIAHQNSERLILLINDMLDIDKIASGQMRFDMQEEALAPLIQKSVESNQPYADKFDVSLKAQPVDESLRVNVDSARLLQVMTNLISNAVKFSTKGDAVEIVAEVRNSHVRISVKDHGPGISEEFRSRIFGKFSQADSSATRAKGGTGLGLHISKQIIEHMGGKIGFDTKIDIGTTFWVDIPIQETQELPEKKLPVDEKKKSRHSLLHYYKERNSNMPIILHVEDDPDLSNVLATSLYGKVDVITATTLKHAELLLKTMQFDMVILDIGLPDGSGLSLLEYFPNLADSLPPVVILSAQEPPDEMRKKVAATMVKSRMSETKIVETILQILEENNYKGEPS